MPTNRKVIDFKIHNLTEEQFQELKEAGQIDPNAIYCTPDETVANFEAVNARINEAIQTEQQHNIEINARVDETVANFEEINTEIEALKDKGGFPLLTAMWADHTLNDMSWLNADTFSWQSGDVYVAAYEHLASEAVFESETKKYIRVKRRAAASDKYYDDDDIYYREPSYDFTSGEEQYEGYIFAWVATGSDSMVVTNTETPAESDVMHYYSKMYPEEPSPSQGRVIETGEETLYSNVETETVEGITITFCRAEDGHKICPAGQEANVQALYEKTGVAWYYILDKENKQFKLPRTKHAFTGLRDSVGGYVEAGVPNIYGYMTNILSDGYDNSSKTHALTAKTASTNFYTPQSSGYGLRAETWTFNASNSNSIYGNSDTVQPPATQMYLYFYVGNFEQSAIEQTAGLNAELFNGKADRDLNNLPSNYDYIVATQEPTSANGYTWFRKYKSGWVEQGGRAVIYDGIAEPNRYDAKDISMPVPMKHCTNWHCQARHDRFNAGIGQDNITTTAHIYQVNDSTNSFTNAFVIWEINGYAA